MRGASGGLILLSLLLLFTLGGCSGRARATPTRTPVPTWTSTPASAAAAPPAGADATQDPALVQPPTAPPAPTTTPIPAPPTPTFTPIPTETPTSTPTPPPTEPPLPTPSPTPDYRFELEAAEKFPTEALAPNVVRIYVYAYSPSEFGLGGYSLRVTKNGAELAVDEVTTAGVPEQTRTDPGPYTRFTNMNAIFVEPQAGDWVLQLVDTDGQPVGPPAVFTLSAEENTRELYVRYRLNSPSD